MADDKLVSYSYTAILEAIKLSENECWIINVE